jgi:hypothetical protein
MINLQRAHTPIEIRELDLNMVWNRIHTQLSHRLKRFPKIDPKS